MFISSSSISLVMMSQHSETSSGARLWRGHDFRLFMVGETISELGNSMGSFALPLAILLLTGSPTSAGLVTAAAVSGSLITSWLAGAAADSWDRRALLLSTLAVRTCTWGIMAAQVMRHDVSAPLFAALAFIGGSASALFNAARAGALRRIIPPNDFPAAMAAMDARDATADLCGAPLAGVLLSASTGLPLMANTLSFLASAGAITRIRAQLNPSEDARGSPQRFFHAVADGYRYVWSRGAFRTLIFTQTLLNFAINSFMFCLILSWQNAHRPGWQIGALQTATAVSTLLGAALAPRLLNRYRIGTCLRGSQALSTLALGTIALTYQQAVATLLLLAAGLVLNPVSNAAENTYMTLTTPDHYQGRVTSFDQFIGRVLLPFAPIAAGALLNHYPPPLALALLTAPAFLAAVALATNASIGDLPHAHAIHPA